MWCDNEKGKYSHSHAYILSECVCGCGWQGKTENQLENLFQQIQKAYWDFTAYTLELIVKTVCLHYQTMDLLRWPPMWTTKNWPKFVIQSYVPCFSEQPANSITKNRLKMSRKLCRLLSKIFVESRLSFDSFVARFWHFGIVFVW